MKNAFASGERSVKARAVATLGNGTGCHLPDVCIKADGSPLGTVRVGSKLAGASGTVGPAEVKILNKLIAPLIGGTVNIDAVGWKGVADATVTFERLRTALGLAAGTTDGVLNTTVTHRRLLDASAFVTDTDHFLSLDLSATDVGAIPGFNFARVKLGFIEAPDTASGAPRDGAGYHTVAETSQVRVLVEVNLILNLTGLGLTDVKVPYCLDAGSAQAFLGALHCSAGSPTPDRVDVLGVTKAGSSKLATVSDTSLASKTTSPVPATARTVDAVGLVTVDTKSVLTISLPGNPGTMLTFNPDYATAPSQSVAGTSISLPTVATTDLNETALVLGLNTAAIALDLSNGINNASPAVKANILTPLYRSLGLSFAGADVWAPPVQECRPTSYSLDLVAPVVSHPHRHRTAPGSRGPPRQGVRADKAIPLSPLRVRREPAPDDGPFWCEATSWRLRRCGVMRSAPTGASASTASQSWVLRPRRTSTSWPAASSEGSMS